MIWLRTWTDYMCMDVFNVFHFTWRSSTNHNTGWGHILVGSEPVHSTMLTFYTLTSDGGGCPAFRHVVIEEGANLEAGFLYTLTTSVFLNINLEWIGMWDCYDTITRLRCSESHNCPEYLLKPWFYSFAPQSPPASPLSLNASFETHASRCIPSHWLLTAW